MGNNGSCTPSEHSAEEVLVECGSCVHEYLFPMYVVKVSDFMQMSGPPEPHHVLREKGLLHEWRAGMFVIFISHQWLGAKAPDPMGTQMAVLRDAMKGLTTGNLKVEADLTSMDVHKALHPSTYEQSANGYIFLDWFAIPQITARAAGVNEEETKSDAALAVQSIPAYVEASDLFIALVPDLVHADTGVSCNYTSWLSRGWCRAELWCRLLSNREDPSVICLFSAKEAEFIFPLDWQQSRISDGAFTVESDREEVVKLGEMALKSKLDHLKSHGRLTHYRFYLAWRAKLLNQDQESWDLNGFLEHFDFPSISEAIKEQKGMTGMCCAVMAGDTKIIRQLVEHRADANARLSGMGDMGYYDTQTVLMMAAKSHQDSSVLATLMTLRADPNIMSRSGISAAWLVRRPSHVQVMLEYRADLYGSFPLNGTAGRASPETVLALLECRCDPTEHTEQGFGALHSVGVFGRANLRCLETARLLLDWRADVNLAAGNSDWMMTMEVLTARMRVALFGLADSTSYSRKVASIHGATPLHMAALQGDKGLVKLLLEYDAELSPNRRGDTPEDLARACGHHDLLPMLSVFQV